MSSVQSVSHDRCAKFIRCEPRRCDSLRWLYPKSALTPLLSLLLLFLFFIKVVVVVDTTKTWGIVRKRPSGQECSTKKLPRGQ
jgi:hypothetical protein